MTADPADRQKAISVLADRLLAVTTGHTRQEAEDVAAALVDEAIAQREGRSSGTASP